MIERGLINETPFAAQDLYLADEEGRAVLAVVVQATYALATDGTLTLSEEQPPVEVAGVYEGDPASSSCRIEPQVAFVKPATDVVLIGHAHAPGGQATSCDVGFQLGPIRKAVRVFGDRVWYSSLGVASMTPPQPFARIPLVYERAFGGWDLSPADPDQHTVERRNPVGVGYHHRRYGRLQEGDRLPNLEDPRSPIRNFTDTPLPAGFGFMGPGWLPRATYAGTYDEAWVTQRQPLLPADFDRRFFNAAPPDQTVPGYLRGNEVGTVVNASPEGQVSFALPGEPPPAVQIALKHGASHDLTPHLDTVIVDMDARQVSLLWRAHLTIPGSRVHDVQAVYTWPHPASRHATPQPLAVPVS